MGDLPGGLSRAGFCQLLKRLNGEGLTVGNQHPGSRTPSVLIKNAHRLENRQFILTHGKGYPGETLFERCAQPLLLAVVSLRKDEDATGCAQDGTAGVKNGIIGLHEVGYTIARPVNGHEVEEGEQLLHDGLVEYAGPHQVPRAPRGAQGHENAV